MAYAWRNKPWMEEQIYLGRWLTLAIGALSVAFGYAGIWFIYAFMHPLSLYSGYLAGAVVGFLLHEVAHRETARRQGCLAGFVLTPLGLALTLLSGLLRSLGFGFAILAPGYVAIYCYGGWGFRGGRIREDLIAAAGPATNIALALAAIPLQLVAPAFAVGFREINAWLALFNLLPFHPLDGSKIMRRNLTLWLAMLLASIILLT
jgi:Zn-dependent protease